MWAQQKCMNLGAPCEITIILDVNIYAKMPAKTIRHNAFQQKHILTCNPSEQLLVGVKPLGFLADYWGKYVLKTEAAVADFMMASSLCQKQSMLAANVNMATDSTVRGIS